LLMAAPVWPLARGVFDGPAVASGDAAIGPQRFAAVTDSSAWARLLVFLPPLARAPVALRVAACRYAAPVARGWRAADGCRQHFPHLSRSGDTCVPARLPSSARPTRHGGRQPLGRVGGGGWWVGSPRTRARPRKRPA